MDWDEVIANAFDQQARAERIENCLARLVQQADLVRFFARYIHFNSIFAGAVSCLAGIIHLRQDLFREDRSGLACCGDRSAEIASLVFAAAEDEYSARRFSGRVTHRSLAQFFLRELVRQCEWPSDRFAELDTLAQSCGERQVVLQGYGLGRTLSDSDLLEAVGFHVASELLADQEFNLINEFLRSNHYALVTALRSTKAQGGANAYYWIAAHCAVEKEHFFASREALDLISKWYCSELLDDAVKEAVHRGMNHFSDLQSKVFEVATT